MNIIFFGSDDFALEHLKALVTSGHQVAACVTQPDRASGRGLKVEASSIKQYALKQRLALLQPRQVKDADFLKELASFNADLFVVIAYGNILPQQVLSMPAKGAINVHGSLLPRYRGAAPINWAIINGDEETGLTIIQMNAKMDAGDIIARVTIPIAPAETAVTLRAKMAKEGPSLLLSTITRIEQGTCSAIKQDASQVSFAPKLSRTLGTIDWNTSAQTIDRLIRGLLPWPGAATTFKGKTLKILAADVVAGDGMPGQVVHAGSDGIVVQAKEGRVRVTEVHLESSKPMAAKDFIAGHQIKDGFCFL